MLHTTHPLAKLLAMTLSLCITLTWLGAVLLGLQTPNTPSRPVVMLPSMTIIGHREATPGSDTPALAEQSRPLMRKQPT